MHGKNLPKFGFLSRRDRWLSDSQGIEGVHEFDALSMNGKEE